MTFPFFYLRKRSNIRIVTPHRFLKSNRMCEVQVKCHIKSTLRFPEIIGFSVCIARTCTEEDITVLNFAQMFQLRSYLRDGSIIYCLLCNIMADISHDVQPIKNFIIILQLHACSGRRVQPHAAWSFLHRNTQHLFLRILYCHGRYHKLPSF